MMLRTVKVKENPLLCEVVKYGGLDPVQPSEGLSSLPKQTVFARKWWCIHMLLES